MILADFHLPKRLRPVVAQLARVLVPAEEIERFGLEEHIVDYLELQLRAFPAGFRLGMVAGLTTLEASAVLRFGAPFSRLAPPQAAAWVASWWSSPISPFRALVRALKSLIALAFYDTPAMRERLSYHPDAWITKVAQKRLETWGLEIQRHEEELRAPSPLVPLRKVRHA